MQCPLCRHQGRPFFKNEFFLCPHCKGIFRNKRNYPTPAFEKNRYLEHRNDPDDQRYRQFTEPLWQYVLQHFSCKDKGLDFGAGTGPVISKVLKERDYDIQTYDPFFAEDPSVLDQTYDYIVCCEVMEHFHEPAQEFYRLAEMLKQGGRLICMTHLYQPGIAFENWYYKNDPTHVFIYQRATIRYITQYFPFKNAEIDGRLMVLCRT